MLKVKCPHCSNETDLIDENTTLEMNNNAISVEQNRYCEKCNTTFFVQLNYKIKLLKGTIFSENYEKILDILL